MWIVRVESLGDENSTRLFILLEKPGETVSGSCSLRCNHFDHELDDVARGAELASSAGVGMVMVMKRAAIAWL